jgi:ubiquinol-cytochrome c reductase cytochrome c subunit
MLVAAAVVGGFVGLTYPPLASTTRSAVQDGAPKPAADDDDDAEEAAYQEVLARRAIEENCLICHEAGMYTSQRLTPAQWKAEVEKMVSWGAPLPVESLQGVIDHLAKTYRDVDPAPPPARVVLASIDSLEIPNPDAEPQTAHGDPAIGVDLYKTNCANCHGPDALGGDLGGPSLVGRAVMNSRAAYDEAVHKGVRKMPAFDKVLNASQQHDVFAWLVQQTRERAKP